MPEQKSYRVSELTWTQVESLIHEDTLAVVPIGAQAKEHGIHLPMNTDYQQVQWLVEQLLDQPGLLIWPVVNYGFYPAFVEFPGSITSSQETFSLLVKEICECIFNTGINRVVLLNSGISTIKPLQQLIENDARHTHLINVYSGDIFKRTVTQLIDQPAGGHADEVETSIMLAINESQVDMAKADGSVFACSQPGVLRRHEKNSPNYTPTGACGKPELASHQKGEKLLTAMLKDINNHILSFKNI